MRKLFEKHARTQGEIFTLVGPSVCVKAAV